MNSLDLSLIIAVYFLFIIVFSRGKNRIHAVIIFIASTLNVLFQLPISENTEQYIYNRNVFVIWDGITAVILTMFLFFDRLAWKKALILSFAVLCHSMIIYDITISSSLFTVFFYNYYDELIIMIGLAQMMISYDIFIRSLRNIQEHIFSNFFYNNSVSQSLSIQESSKDEA